MTRSAWSLGLMAFGFLSLSVGCSSESPSKAQGDDACDAREGDSCECEDGTESEFECIDDEAVCKCEEPATSDDSEDDDEPVTPLRDAGAPPKDASKPIDSAAPKADASTADATTSADSGSTDASVPSDNTKPDPAMLPKPTAACPEIKEGTVTFKGSRFRIYVGDDGESKLGPLVFYWYATGSNVSEVTKGLSDKIVAEIKSQGGMVAAMETSTAVGQSTGNFVWYVEDYKLADEVLACAIEQKVGIDMSRIHAIGFSAGGLQSSWMAYARSNYMASVVAYSGGLTGLLDVWVTPVDMTPDPSNVVSAMLIHGAQGRDVVVMDFALGSAAMEADIKKKDGFSLDCNHGGGHMIPMGIQDSAWQFMKDHPYKTKPSPYIAGGIPRGFPSYCKIP